MIISANTRKLSNCYAAMLIEPPVNREASKYIENNYSTLLKIAMSHGVDRSKAEDLIQDVWLSVYRAESNGDGFDSQYGIDLDTNTGSIMNVEQYIATRIRLYAMNDKYNSNICDSYSSKKDSYIVVQASFDEAEKDTSTDSEFQRAYRNAQTVNTIADKTEELSLREQIDYCIDICDKYGVNILNLFKNIDMLSTFISDVKNKTKDSIFSSLNRIAAENDEFETAFISVLRYASIHEPEFSAIMESF